MTTSGGGRPPPGTSSPQSTMIGFGNVERESDDPSGAASGPATGQPPGAETTPGHPGTAPPAAPPGAASIPSSGPRASLPPPTRPPAYGARTPTGQAMPLRTTQPRTAPPRPPPKTPPRGSAVPAGIPQATPSDATTAPAAYASPTPGVPVSYSGPATAPAAYGGPPPGSDRSGPGYPPASGPQHTPQLVSGPHPHPVSGAHVGSHPHPMSAPPSAPPPSGPTSAPPAYYDGTSGPHAGGAPGWQPQVASGPSAGQVRLPGVPSSSDTVDLVPGSDFVRFLKISSRRAFRLRIKPNEVLAEEREALLAANPPVHDPNLQAFLAWRRSILFLVACFLVPIALIGLIGALQNTQYKAIIVVKLVPALAELLFCWICWGQLKRWAHWRTQRRWLFIGWLIFMLTPFVVFVYPLRTFFAEAGSLRKDALAAFGMEGVRSAVLPFMLSMMAMLQLAPKAISLMPGLIRASMVIKLLFPGVSAPGWLIVMASPLYALLVYVILIIPYQFTGSGWFIVGILGLVAGQAVLARAGFSLATPLSEDEAEQRIKRVRTLYLSVMIFSALMIVVALGSLVKDLRMSWTDVVTAVLKFETNVLILTMIAADLVITNLDRARQQTAGRTHVEHETEMKIAAFVSVEAPHAPPPPGPATAPDLANR